MSLTVPPSDSLPDETLMQALQEGNLSAFTLLYRRFERRLYNFLLRMTGNLAQAEDLFQETFLRVYRARHRYNSESRFRPWLYTIAHNLCRDLEKSRRREAHLSGELSLGIPDPRGNPLTLLLETEREERIRRAIQALPERERLILILSRYEDLRYTEIAEILGMTPGAVKMAAHRALDTLRAELQVD